MEYYIIKQQIWLVCHKKCIYFMGRVVYFDAVKNDMYQMCIVHSLIQEDTVCFTVLTPINFYLYPLGLLVIGSVIRFFQCQLNNPEQYEQHQSIIDWYLTKSKRNGTVLYFTHCGCVMHRLSVDYTCIHRDNVYALSVPSHYLIQCWLIINWPVGKKTSVKETKYKDPHSRQLIWKYRL